MLILLCILLPVAAGALLPLFRFRKEILRDVYVLVFTLLTSAAVLQLLLAPGETVLEIGEIYPGLRIAFRADGIAKIYAALIAALWPLCVLYGFAYMRHEERPNSFFAWYTVTYGVTLACAFSADLFTLYLFYECLSLSTLPLVSHKQDEASLRAGRLYVLYTVTGAALGFVAMAVVFGCTGTLDFVPGGILTSADPTLLSTMRWVFVLAFLGFGVKAAVFPLSAWLPEASVAPTPVTALLHAVAVVNTGAFAVARVTYETFGAELLRGSTQQAVCALLACFTMVFGSATAVRVNHLKRRLAWSTVSNLSYMLMGICLLTAPGLTGALTHLIFHGLMKITLFLCAGAIITQCGLNYVREMGGLIRVMPAVCVIFAIASCALVGTPPLVGFVSKLQLLNAASLEGSWLGIVSMVALIVSAVLTAIYLFSAVGVMCFRPAGPAVLALGDRRHDAPWEMLLPLLLFTAAQLVLGVWSSPLTDLLRTVSGSMV